MTEAKRWVYGPGDDLNRISQESGWPVGQLRLWLADAALDDKTKVVVPAKLPSEDPYPSLMEDKKPHVPKEADRRQPDVSNIGYAYLEGRKMVQLRDVAEAVGLLMLMVIFFFLGMWVDGLRG